MKSGRNDPCPCGSGLKFKRCHGAAGPCAPISRQTMIELMRREPPPTCLCPRAARLGPCEGQIIKSHTLQRNGSLSELATGGEVYHFKPEFMSLENTGGKFRVLKRPIRQCSTSPLFCRFHDAELFRAIETVLIVPSAEQAFLFGFRALSREVYAKRKRAEAFRAQPDFASSAIPRRRPQIRAIVEAEKRALRHGLRISESLKQRWDDLLVSGDFGAVRYWAGFFSALPRIMCSGAFMPEVDFEGNALQRLSIGGPDPEPLTLTITCAGGRGLVMFTWLSDPRGASEQFVRSFTHLPSGAAPSILIDVAARKIENLYFAPDWWEQVDAETQRYFEECALCGTVLQGTPKPNGDQHGTALRWDNLSIHTTM